MGIYDREYYQDDDIRPIRPWDNRSLISILIIVNAAFYVANKIFTSRDNTFTDALSLYADSLFNPLAWYRLVTYGFAHSPNDIFHIIFNMLTLYFLGQAVESKYGKAELLRFYLITIVVCGIAWCLLHMGSPVPVLGASGAVTAVAMLFVFSFPHATLMLYGVLPVKAWILGLLIVIGNVIGGRGNVAYDVHLVGAGCAAIYFYSGLNFGSLGGWWDGARQSWRKRRSGLKVHSPTPPPTKRDSRDEQEADRLLEKIHREGKDSLSAKERRFLEQYSQRVRQKRDS